MIGDLLRVDLIKRNWAAYAFVATAALAIHVAWALRFGISPSTDFAVRYDPGARALLTELGLHRYPADIGFSWAGYGGARIGYIAFVAACYALFGASLGAVVYPQLAIVWLVYPFIFHTLLHISGRLRLTVAAICVWLTYYDGYQWQFWGLPDALYRLLFVATFFVLLRLWETHRDVAFVWTTIVAAVVGTVLRVETPLYALVPLGISFTIMKRRHPAAIATAVAVFVAFLWIDRAMLRDIGSTFVDMQTQGRVLPGSGLEIPGLTSLAHPTDHSWVNWLQFFARLAAMRFWHAVTPLPALWSRSHQLYYGAYLIVGYALAFVGLVDAVHRHDRVFLLCFWLFTAGALLQVLVAVDPSMRYGYSSQVFLFLCAAMGWPAMSARFARLSPSSRTAHAVAG